MTTTADGDTTTWCSPGERLEALVAEARLVVGGLDPAVLSTADATAVVEQFATLEKLAAAGKVRCAARAAEGSAWSKAGERSPERWLARRSGTTVAEAERQLGLSARLGSCPLTEAALGSGALSVAQAAEVAMAAEVDPGAEERLVAVARRAPMRTLREEVVRVRAAARGEDGEARARRHHAERRLSFRTGVDGECRISGSCSALQGARINAAVAAWRDAVFADARAQGRRDPLDASTLDALDRALAAVVTDGVDVHSVTHFGRSIPAVVRTALQVRDRACVVPGCGNTGYLEIDHTTSATGWADTGRTRLSELARLCTHHHDHKTHHRWQLTGGPGTWHWHPPADQETGRSPPDRHAA